MKKIVAVLYAVLLGFAFTAYAADADSNPKLNEAKELRVQAVKAQMQADSLLKRAQAIELEIAQSQKNSGEKMRGREYPSSCISSCIGGNHGDYYLCAKSCGWF